MILLYIHCVPKKWDCVICNILYRCKSILQWNLTCDIPITFAIKCAHNFPPHISYVSTLPDITQKLKRDIDELKHQRSGQYSPGHHRQSHWPVANTAACTLTSWSINTRDRIPQAIIDKATDQWQTRLRAYIKAKKCQFEHLLWSSHTTRYFQSHSHNWEEDNINFQFFL